MASDPAELPGSAGRATPVRLAALGGAVIAVALVAGAVFIGVAVHELNYASGHPYRYGPAKVIALAACAGTLLCIAVGLLGYAVSRHDRR